MTQTLLSQHVRPLSADRSVSRRNQSAFVCDSVKMGKPNSKEETPEEVPDPSPQTNVNAAEVDSSSGFHILEIHTATSMFGAGFTIFAIVLVVIIWYLVRRCRNRRRAPYQYPYLPGPVPSLAQMPGPPALAPGSTTQLPVLAPPQPLMQSPTVPAAPPRVIYVERRPRRPRHQQEDRFVEIDDEEVEE